jgi:hypothetical protein
VLLLRVQSTLADDLVAQASINHIGEPRSRARHEGEGVCPDGSYQGAYRSVLRVSQFTIEVPPRDLLSRR